MTADEELIHLRHENRLLREQVSVQRDLTNRQQEQITLRGHPILPSFQTTVSSYQKS